MSRSNGWVLGAALLAATPAMAQAPDEEDVLVEDDDSQGRDRPDQGPGTVTNVVEGPQELADAADDRARTDLGGGGDTAAPADGEGSWQDRIEMAVVATSSVFATDNRDLRKLDESSYDAIRYSDDRRDFAHSDVLATLGYTTEAAVRFDLQVKFDTLWGEDQLNRRSGAGGAINVYQLSTTYAPLDTDLVGVAFTIGRQPFTIGGVPNDYLLAGTLDAITATLDLRALGRFRVLALDFFGGNDLPSTGYQYYRSGVEPQFGLRGDTNTLRHGVVYEIDDDAIEGLPIEARLFWFYALIGGGPVETSGADITRGGLNGNYADNDYQHMAGGRVAWVHDFEGGGEVRVYGEYARSEGIDRKEVVARDVVTSGNAYGGGVDLDWNATPDFALLFGAEFYHFDGARYASDGFEFERGFVGFKGARIGGMTLGRQSAWRPASHVDALGVRHTPHELSRVAGTQFLHVGAGAALQGTRLTVDYWLLDDTGTSFLDPADLDDLPEPPFGYTRGEFAGEARMGLRLGQAFDVRVEQALGEHFSLHLGYGRFMPGDYYGVEVDPIASTDAQETALGGGEAFWVVDFGGRVAF
ncbi:MAG: hypothetical protein H6705_21095 [Myxococcales bacterium]|nr:hypothetical protein [Myxococcales bacterium]